MPMMDATEIYEREIVTTRVFDAPRDLVWRMWSEPDQIKEWWGPAGFTNTFHEFDFRPGGRWRFIMHGPDGTDYDNETTFVEIVRLERIVMDHASEPHFRLTASFEEVDGKTKLIFRQLFERAETCRGVKHYAVKANEEVFDKLAARLSIARAVAAWRANPPSPRRDREGDHAARSPRA